MADLDALGETGPDRAPRALVIDDEPVVRKGLGCLLRERRADARVCEAGDLEAAVHCAATCRPDLILLDTDLRGRRPPAVIRALDAAAPHAKIVVIAQHLDPRDARSAFSAGADGYVAKDASTAELLRALDEIEAGGKYLDPRVGAILAADILGSTGASTLTGREQRVLDLVAMGLTNREIAEELGLSLRTIESTRGRAQRKLGLHQRSDVVAYVRSH